jgi:hypothetical protein
MNTGVQTMEKLARQDLFSLEQYAVERSDFRARVLEHKKPRKVMLGDHLTLYFEDRMTMQYQIQEMLRIEKIFEADGIQEELDAYNPLIPDGSNFKATVMVEYEDVEERKQALAKLVGIEDKIWVQVEGHDRVYAISDEDLERADADKTSAVHFSRFELTPAMVDDLKSGRSLSVGCDHENYQCELLPVDEATRQSLVSDLN